MGRWGAWSQLRQLKASSRCSSSHSPRRTSASLGSLFLPPTYGFCSPFIRFSSTIPAVSDSYDGVLGSGHYEHIQRNEWESHEDEGTSRYIPVKAYFLSTSIDLKSIQTENVCYVIPPSSRSSNYVALRYSDYPLDIGINENGDNCRYVVVFQYGSVILFNIADHEAEQYLDLVRKHAHRLLPETRKDDYAVVEKPQLTSWMHGGADYIALKSLDMDGIRIICNVLGQSIALDHYIGQVDDMVEEFTDINRGMEKTGTFTMKRKKLFQLVGKANSNLADVIIKLGLFDRSEIAWRNSNYAQILEYLREEYELAQRFGSLNFKLKFVEHNIHFLQEVLQNKKSDLLEWVIIILLLIENIISMYEILKTSTVIPP
ncbi:uncharacterized protein LOC110023341 [Phalaenopsis equestris]|uniref:uncharacterized protein LOC110023341 n=1 Tax=Phalaenopsis equestris TaxID=78828 RepID=UPI0009E3F26D|nr:uncharacterized protein LOC110023341 [Phalaenopsis equestris]